MREEEIMERLEKIAKHAVHVFGEEPFFMSLDDGIAIHEAIDILKTKDVPHWIPVTERLPDEDGRYLVSFPSLFGERRCIDVESFSHDLESVDNYGFEGRKRAGWYSYDDEYGYLERDGVVAWMPLPEPYREDGDNDADC